MHSPDGGEVGATTKKVLFNEPPLKKYSEIPGNKPFSEECSSGMSFDGFSKTLTGMEECGTNVPLSFSGFKVYGKCVGFVLI